MYAIRSYYDFIFNRRIFKNHIKAVLVGGFLFILFFSLLSINKVTLGSRDYYIQSISALTRYPLGVGYGNFSKISNDPRFHPFGLNDYSSYAHSLIFEWIGGVGFVSLLGLLGLLFLMFLFGKRVNRITSYNVCYTKLLRHMLDLLIQVPQTIGVLEMVQLIMVTLMVMGMKT